MIDGEVEHGRVWFAFDAKELEWLYHLIPAGDDFKKTVALKMRELEEYDEQPTTS